MKTIKNFMTKQIMVAFACLLAMSLTACSSDEDDNDQPAKPKVTLTEVGHDNLHKAQPGHELHIEADILAEGLIEAIIVEMKHEKEEHKINIKNTFTNPYKDSKNAEFHEHIAIPANAPLGEYRLSFIVNDKLGQQTIVESRVDVVEDAGDDDVYKK